MVDRHTRVYLSLPCIILRKLNFEDDGVVVDNRGRLWSVGRIDSLGEGVLLTADLRSSWCRLTIFRVFGRVQVRR